jgi:hypothetical protein
VSLEYVRESRRQSAYFRKRPYHRDTPTKAQRELRAALARLAFEQGREKNGLVVVEKDGMEKTMPASAVPIMNLLKGKTFRKPEVPAQKPVEELREILERLRALST